MTTGLRLFVEGFLGFFRGLGLLVRTPRLWPYAVMPFIIGFVLLSFGVYWAVMNLGPYVALLVATLTANTGFWLGVATWTVLILAWPAFLIALFFIVFIAARIVAGPFHSLLAERALIAIGALKDQPFSVGKWLRNSLRMFVVSIVKALVFLVVGVILFFLSLVPVLNIVAGFGFMLVVAFDSADYSFEALQMGFRDRLRYFSKNFYTFSGFAVALGLVFFIPGFNFLLFPVAVTGASELVGLIEKAKSPS